jgi:oligopeptidase B
MDPALERVDEYFWLRDDTRSNTEVIAHLKAENAFLEAKTSSLDGLRQKIYEEHIFHLKETDRTAAYADGSAYYYYDRTVKGLSHTIYCRVPASAIKNGDVVEGPDGAVVGEEVILDVNELAKGQSQCDVANLDPEPSRHELFAYTVDFKGDEMYEVRFLGKGAESFAAISNVSSEFEWGLDGRHIFYVTKDAAKRSDKIWVHANGTPQSEDVCLLEEPDELFNVDLKKTRCGNHMILDSSSSETTEQYILDLGLLKSTALKDLPAAMKLVRKRESGVRFDSDVASNGDVFIVTNIGKKLNNSILRSSMANLGADWASLPVLVEHSEARKIDALNLFESFMVVTGREAGLTQAWFLTREGELKKIEMAEPVYTVKFSAQNKNYDTKAVRLAYSSPTSPMTWLDIAPSGTRTIIKQKTINGYNPQEYVCERLSVPSVDGTLIDISVVRRKDLDMTKPHPAMLYGYGSYGICINPEFEMKLLPFLKRGMVYCIAHIRGGGENGRAWYEVQGKYHTKRNTFYDFISCAEYLIKAGITTPAQLATEGRSAGGLLMGAVLNMRPDLFKVAVAGVPFVDVMTTMCDASIPLTTGEWEEWGNPNEHKYFDYMLSYSPIDNVREQFYPHVLIVAGLHDPRVAYWEPTKWATKLRKMNRGNNDILVKMDLDVGHFSASDRYKFWKEKAFEQAYVLNRLGVETGTS